MTREAHNTLQCSAHMQTSEESVCQPDASSLEAESNKNSLRLQSLYVMNWDLPYPFSKLLQSPLILFCAIRSSLTPRCLGTGLPVPLCHPYVFHDRNNFVGSWVRPIWVCHGVLVAIWETGRYTRIQVTRPHKLALIPILLRAFHHSKTWQVSCSSIHFGSGFRGSLCTVSYTHSLGQTHRGVKSELWRRAVHFMAHQKAERQEACRKG